MKSDCNEAVSTVVALMLVLAILATCIAIYSATYVPGLKQQSEILHSEEVQYAFQRLSSDVDNLYSLGKSAQFSEPVPLGGGDILLSPVKSSGTIELEKNQIGTLSIVNESGSFSVPINTTNITYTPSYSSWELQGYTYRNGVVWIMKGAKRTPADISLYTVQAGLDRENSTKNQWLERMGTVIPEGNGNYTMRIVTMTPVAGKISATGSGTAKILLNAAETRHFYENVTTVTLNSQTLNDFPSQANLILSTLSVEVSVE